MRRLRSLKFLWIGLLAIGLAGCANLTKRAFDKEANGDVKTIGLIEPAKEDKIQVDDHNAGDAAIAFGLIGGIAAGINAQSKTNRFNLLLKEHDFDLVHEFQEALARELRNCGYSVKMMKRQGPWFKLMESYEGLDTDVDAYLDGKLEAAYVKERTSPAFIPALQVRIRLVKRETRKSLYQANYFYGFEWGIPSVENIHAEEGCSFKEFDDLMSDPNKAIEGLSEGAAAITKRIAGALSRGEQ